VEHSANARRHRGKGYPGGSRLVSRSLTSNVSLERIKAAR
jgi:hypothetical protein